MTALIILAILAKAPLGHTFYFVRTLNQKRVLLGAGYTSASPTWRRSWGWSASPVSTGEDHLQHAPLHTVRSRVLGAKLVVTSYWTILMVLLSLVVVLVVGLPWNTALGGTVASVTDQTGAVIPGLVVAAILLGLFGLGFGVLVKNRWRAS